MKLITRKVDPDSANDLRGFNALMSQLSNPAEDEELLKSVIRRLNAREDAWLLVAEDKESGVLAGSLLGILTEDLCGDCTPFLMVENVVTLEEYRRQGVGRKMFEDLEAWAREKGARYSFLCSQMHRTEAHAFYPSVGYNEIKGYRKKLQ